MIEVRDEWRMYGLVCGSLSPIQQGIQFGHAVVEYGLMYFHTPEYQDWARKDKTFIILNGGTSNDGVNYPLGSLNTHYNALLDNEIPIATFREPDLNDMLTAIVFLVNEKVYKKDDYPGFDTFMNEQLTSQEFVSATIKGNFKDQFSKQYQNWTKFVGGSQNAFLKEFLTQFRLA